MKNILYNKFVWINVANITKNKFALNVQNNNHIKIMKQFKPLTFYKLFMRGAKK
jgi:hypothetical protein